MQLGLFLKQYRHETKLSGNRLAQKIGISKHALDKYENAGTMPGYESATKLMDYFGLNSLSEISQAELTNGVTLAALKPSRVNGKIKKQSNNTDNYDELYQIIIAEKDRRIAELEEIIILLNEKIIFLKSHNDRKIK